MFKKITKESKKWQIVSGIITGVLAAVLCVSFGLMSAVSSTAVYQSAYKKGCVSLDMDIDGDNFASYYNAMLKFSSFGDAAKLEQARFTANGQEQAIFLEQDVWLLRSAGNVYTALKIAAAVCSAVIVVFFIVICVKKGKNAGAILARFMLIGFLICAVIIAVSVACVYLSGHSIDDAVYGLLTGGAIREYTQGNLALIYGRVTMEVCMRAFMCMSGLFAAIAAFVLLLLSRMNIKRGDPLDDYMYQ